jgi:hypothetical protein
VGVRMVVAANADLIGCLPNTRPHRTPFRPHDVISGTGGTWSAEGRVRRALAAPVFGCLQLGKQIASRTSWRCIRLREGNDGATSSPRRRREHPQHRAAIAAAVISS